MESKEKTLTELKDLVNELPDGVMIQVDFTEEGEDNGEHGIRT